MPRWRLFLLLCLVPMLAVLLASAGSDGQDKKEPTELPSTGWATIKGKVTYDGDPPKPADFKDRDDFKMHLDQQHCLKGDTISPDWKVGKDGGVANVVVWLIAPPNTYFKLPPAEKKFWPDEVTIDQPFCMFHPNVVVLFPSYYDPQTKKPKRTGQVFKVLNSAPIAHNIRILGDGVDNVGFNETLQGTKPGGPVTERAVVMNPYRIRIPVNCDLHKWMEASIWAFNHPYATVTKGDRKEEEKVIGTYEIKLVPAGVELSLGASHKEIGWLLPEAEPVRGGMKIGPLKDGEVKEINFKIKKK